ncbi:MAG: hypothetical protein J6333_04745, partial [Planctomycetes bacterium]|nr:hypothetical protein [Planctomycetota bacterium]
LLAPALAGEAAPGKTAPQAAAAGTPSAGQGDGDGSLSDPELLAYLREEAERLGFPHMKTYGDFSGFLGINAQYHDKEKTVNAPMLTQKILFVLSERMVPSKENCLKAIQAPEEWAERRFSKQEERPGERPGEAEEWAMWRGHNDLKRGHAFAILIGGDMLTPADLPALRESLRSARRWRSMVAAIKAVSMLDWDEGQEMARSFLWSEDYPIEAKIDLMQELSERDAEFEVIDEYDLIAKALQGDESFQFAPVRFLLMAIAAKIAHDGDQERQESMQKMIGTTFDKAEENAKQALENIAKARAEFERTLAGEGARTNAAPKPQENRAQGKPQGETPKEPQGE